MVEEESSDQPELGLEDRVRHLINTYEPSGKVSAAFLSRNADMLTSEEGRAYLNHTYRRTLHLFASLRRNTQHNYSIEELSALGRTILPSVLAAIDVLDRYQRKDGSGPYIDHVFRTTYQVALKNILEERFVPGYLQESLNTARAGDGYTVRRHNYTSWVTAGAMTHDDVEHRTRTGWGNQALPDALQDERRLWAVYGEPHAWIGPHIKLIEMVTPIKTRHRFEAVRMVVGNPSATYRFAALQIEAEDRADNSTDNDNGEQGKGFSVQGRLENLTKNLYLTGEIANEMHPHGARWMLKRAGAFVGRPIPFGYVPLLASSKGLLQRSYDEIDAIVARIKSSERTYAQQMDRTYGPGANQGYRDFVRAGWQQIDDLMKKPAKGWFGSGTGGPSFKDRVHMLELAISDDLDPQMLSSNLGQILWGDFFKSYEAAVTNPFSIEDTNIQLAPQESAANLLVAYAHAKQFKAQFEGLSRRLK